MVFRGLPRACWKFYYRSFLPSHEPDTVGASCRKKKEEGVEKKTAPLAMVEMPAAGGEPAVADGLRQRARQRRVNINTDDESEIGRLPGVSFIEARRICMERPFQGMQELLKVRGMSRDLIQQWESGQPLPHTLPTPCLRVSRATIDVPSRSRWDRHSV